MNNIPRIAFIAKYAPITDVLNPVKATRENEVYSKYHFDIYSILCKHFQNVVVGNDADFIIKHHNDFDYIFSLLNRAPYRNSEIFISALAEYYKLPYLGARPNIRAIAEDKNLSKILAKYCNIITPNWITADIGSEIKKNAPFKGPYFVKPRYGASSMNIDESSICETWDQVINKTKQLQVLGEDVIIEEFINGIYYSSPVVFNDGIANVLPPVKEKSNLKGNVVTYLQKRKVDGGLIRTVETNHEIANIIEHASKKIATQIQPIDYTRIDYIVTPENKLYFLEFNVCCNLGIQSSFVLSAKSVSISHEELIMNILNESFWRQGLGRHY